MAQEWGTQPLDFTGEPKKIFTNFLIWNLKQIETLLYYSARPSQSLKPLCGLIGSLDAKSQKALKPQLEELQKMYGKYSKWSREDLEKIFQEVSAYLHDNYLKETYYATPRYPSKKLTIT